MASTDAAPSTTSLPDPYQRTPHPTLGPSPPPVMEQVFWVEVGIPPETKAVVSAPEGVKLLDQTKPGRGRQRTRFYFRSDRGVKDGQVVIRQKGGETFRLPLRILTYREDLEEKVRDVEGLDPSARKQGRSYYTKDMVELAKANLRQFPHLRDDLTNPSRFDEMDDAQLFASLPSWEVPRQCYSNWPCPFCGEEVFKTSGFYPWVHDEPGTFKCRCPVCDRTFPTNDFARDDFTSGEFPDDGWGYDPGSGDRDEHHGWVAYHNHHPIWQSLGVIMQRMALRYLLFGDEAAAHRVGMLCARLAYVYAGMDMRWQQVKTAYLRPGRLLVDGNWERVGILVPAAQAYDAIFDYLDGDSQLAEFLHGKDSVVNSPDDVKALIETYFIQLMGWDWLGRRLSGGNMGAREADLAHMAVCADMGHVSERWIEELFTHAYNSNLNKGGFDDEVLVNTMTREGIPWISALGYAYGYTRSKSSMAEVLSRVTSLKWQSRCDLFDPQFYPKFRAEYDAWIEILVAGQWGPNYGDSGGPTGSQHPDGIPAQLRTAYARAYRRWPTDELARALHRAGRQDPGLCEVDVWADVEARVNEIGPAPPPESRVMDGVGFALLESRSHESELRRRAGVALRYGYGLGHHHQDNLNIELWAHGLCIAPELGYPCWAHPMGDTTHVAHHNTGLIDHQPQYAGGIGKGALELFAGAPEASFAEVSAEPGGFPNRMYRRAVCLADAPGGNVYLLDILRLAGGRIRTHCLHGPPYDDFQSSLEFEPKEDGHFATENIAEPQHAISDGLVWADWKYLEHEARLRVTHLGATGRRYVTAACAKPDIPPLRYLFAEDEAADGASEFVCVWEPYTERPFLEKVERLDLEHSGCACPEGFASVAIRVTLEGGQVDTFFHSLDPECLCKCGGIEFKGSFGYWSELNGRLRCLHLVNGERLLRGDEGVASADSAFRAKIVRADLAGSVIELDKALPETVSAGAVLWIRGGRHRTAYHVAEVLPGRSTIRLDLHGRIYRSSIVRISDDRTHLACELPPPVEAARTFKPGYYDDAVVTGEDLKARYRVVKVEDDRIYVDRPIDSDDFPDVSGDGRRMAQIYDYGEGDEVTVYHSVFLGSVQSKWSRKG